MNTNNEYVIYYDLIEELVLWDGQWITAAYSAPHHQCVFKRSSSGERAVNQLIKSLNKSDGMMIREDGRAPIKCTFQLTKIERL